MLNNLPTENVKITDDILVTVPSSFQLMTPYILIEQQDWFEDEISFIRKIIKPGDKVIDIGANYGLYTLSMAVKIGESGKIWAFEPTSYVSECLAKSITENNLNNIELIKAGLSDHNGTAKFFTSPNSELNSLHPEDNAVGNYETIELITLDDCAEKFNWKAVDFIKLDAEGEEINIVNGGRNVLTALSPLIMFELKHGKNLNLPLIEKFDEYGYKSYYLISELNLLVPFDKEKPFDSFQLNLFCCKEDKAYDLKNEGLLINSSPENIPSMNEINTDGKIWKEYIAKLPFSHSLFNEWDNLKEENLKPDWNLYQLALNSYVFSKSEDISPPERFGYLIKAYNKLNELIKNNATFPRLMSFVRIAYELGKRGHAVEILATLINKFGASIQDLTNEPFIPVSQRYEDINPENRIKEWIISSILEQYEKLHAFSSYFTGKNSLQILKKLGTLGFQSPEMERRLHLIQKRFNTQKSID